MKILVIDDEEQVRTFVGHVLRHSGYDCTLARGAERARASMKEQEFSLVLCDLKIPAGLDLLRYVRTEQPQSATLIMTAADSPEIAHIALEVGAYGYLVKPFGSNQLLINVANSLHRRALQIENGAHRESLERLVQQRTEALELALGELKRAEAEKENILGAIPSVLIGLDEKGLVTRWNSPAEQAFGISAKAAVGQPFTECGIQWHDPGAAERILQSRNPSHAVGLEDLRFTDRQGTLRFLGVTVNPMRAADNGKSGHLLHAKDVTERKSLEAQRRRAQKLEAVGQLAAGIAHEINTPIQYIGDNTQFLRDAFADMQCVMEAGVRLVKAARHGTITPELVAELEVITERADIQYLTDEIPKAIHQSADGVERVSRIVRAMKEFSHPGGDEKTTVDINRTIENTIIVSRNEWKYVADTITHLNPSLPLVSCLPGEISQVLLNLIVNAAHAIGDTILPDSGQRGTITISTRPLNNGVEMRISDTGSGIPDAIRDRIFEPFFTTKSVGKGTGQGLMIAHAVVVQKHGGKISFETEVGKGTTFIVWLPLEDSIAAASGT